MLKRVKGDLRATKKLRFGASAWVGPTYRPGEERLVFLAPIRTGHAYYDKARWSSVEAGKVDLFFAHEDLRNCSEASLLEFVRMIETANRSPPRFECKFLRSVDSHRRRSINLVNESDQTVWLNPSRMIASFEASQVRYALPVRWNQGGDGGWIPLKAGSTLSGHASVDTQQLGEAQEMTITLGHVAARFPHPSWVGFRSVGLKIKE